MSNVFTPFWLFFKLFFDFRRVFRYFYGFIALVRAFGVLNGAFFAPTLRFTDAILKEKPRKTAKLFFFSDVICIRLPENLYFAVTVYTVSLPTLLWVTV